MKLETATIGQVSELRTWFPDPESLARWGGPRLPFGATHPQFLEGISWERIPALCAVDEHGRLLAFGQYYSRQDRCHLARLVVRPDVRGSGTGKRFITQLMNAGMKALEASECSLFVMTENRAAIACYRSLGFRSAPWPDDEPKIAGVQFMLRPGTPS